MNTRTLKSCARERHAHAALHRAPPRAKRLHFGGRRHLRGTPKSLSEHRTLRLRTGAVCTRSSSRTQQARAVYESVLASDPHDMKAISGLVERPDPHERLSSAPMPSWTAPPARPALSRSGPWSWTLYLREGRLDEAVTLAKSYVERNPSNPVARVALAELLWRRGDLKEARSAFDAALNWRRISRSRSGARISTSRRTARPTPWRFSEKSSKNRGRTRCRRFWPSRCRPTARSRKPATS